jgi:hypothetical protein
MNWRSISLYRYQKIDAIIHNPHFDDFEKTMFCVCEVYGITESQLDALGIKKAAKMANRVAEVMKKEPRAVPRKRIGKYLIEYNPENYSFGQYVELMFFLQNPLQHAHNVLASVARLPFRRNNSATHIRRSDYFHRRSIEDIIGALNAVQSNLTAFNATFRSLFGLDTQVHDESAVIHKFNKHYGWQYSARQIAKDQGIPLEKAFRLPAREALNALDYLKAQGRYEQEIVKQSSNGK